MKSRGFFVKIVLGNNENRKTKCGLVMFGFNASVWLFKVSRVSPIRALMKLKARVFVKQEIINYLIYLPLTLLQLWTSWSQWLWQNNSTILFGEFACITIHYFKNLVMAFFY